MTDERPIAGAMPLASPPPLSRRFWGFPITRILIFFAVYVLLLLFIGLGLHEVLKALSQPQNLNESLTTTLGYGCMALAVVLALAVMVKWFDKRSLASAGLTFRGIFSETGIGLLIGGGVFSAVIGLMQAVGVYHIAGVNPHFHPQLPLVMFFFLAVFQEIAVRGYLFQTLETRWGTLVALITSTLFFGLAHLGSPVEGLTTLQWLVGPVFIAFETGLLFTAAYLLTRRLWLPIGLHWGWNFFESSIYGTANTGTGGDDPNTLFYDYTHGSFALTGGPFGPEASLICLIVGTYAGVLLLRMAIRKGQWRGAITLTSETGPESREKQVK
jgi:membrane protease YdiL (CAAX protease family)